MKQFQYTAYRWGTILLTMLFFLLWAPDSRAQEPDSLNGYWWTNLPLEFKLGFILGYQEGFKMAFGQVLARNQELPGSTNHLTPDYLNGKYYLEARATCGQIEKELEQLYTKEPHKIIYIFSAINIALMKLHGVPEDNVQAAIEHSIKATNVLQENKQNPEAGKDASHTSPASPKNPSSSSKERR